MIDVEHALALKNAGLAWRPFKGDTFTLPESELAHQVFTLNDQTILVHMVQGYPTVTFHGSSEWALDDILVTDVVWLPSETQLREAIQLRLGGAEPSLELAWAGETYRCTIRHMDQQHIFDSALAEHAYADALLAVMEPRES